MAIVTERLNASKPPPPAADLKSGKLAPGQLNNNKDLDVDPKKDESSFFGSFFSATKNAPKKKGAAIMEVVRFAYALRLIADDGPLVAAGGHQASGSVERAGDA